WYFCLLRLLVDQSFGWLADQSGRFAPLVPCSDTSSTMDLPCGSSRRRFVPSASLRVASAGLAGGAGGQFAGFGVEGLNGDLVAASLERAVYGRQYASRAPT